MSLPVDAGLNLGLLDVRPDDRAGNPAFARHGTFHPRFGWLKKGFDAATADRTIFAREDAAVVLGVGKNMVRAIRYWCHAFGVLAEAGTGSVPTDFGRRLLGPTGRDPYLEDLASLWMLHWALLRPDGLATAWHFGYFTFTRSEFTTEEMVRDLDVFVRRAFPLHTRIAASSLRKDAACFTRMYATPAQSERAWSDETIQCPFADLGLITQTDPKTFAFNGVSKPTLPPLITAAACLEYAARRSGDARTIALSDLAYGIGSPGLAFRLGQSSLYEALELAVRETDCIQVAHSAGVIQLSFDRPPGSLAMSLIDEYYDTATLEIGGSTHAS
ncbi:MAG: DUF4007 family protein [Gemmatimonadaceae bacterium]